MRWFLTLFLLLALNASAASYYVDYTDGLDSNNGTSTATPWKTLNRVQTNSGGFAAGDAIHFQKGERWPMSQIFTSAWSRVVYTNYGSGNPPVFDGLNAIRKGIYNPSATNVTFYGIEVRDIGNAGTGANIEFAQNGTNWVIHCIVNTNSFDAGLAVSTADGGTCTVVVSNTLITRCADEGITQHGNSRLYLFNVTNTYCFEAINDSGSGDPMNLIIDGWVLENNGDGTGGGGDWGDLDTAVVEANRVWWKGRTDGVAMKFITSGDSAGSVTIQNSIFDASRSSNQTQPGLNLNWPVHIKNSVFYGGPTTRHGAITVSGSTSTCTNCIFDGWERWGNVLSGAWVVDHALTNNVTISAQSSQTSLTSPVAGNPLFVDAPNGDFRLSSGSPAINAGVSIGITTDYAGNSVGNPPEIGPFEFLDFPAWDGVSRWVMGTNLHLENQANGMEWFWVYNQGVDAPAGAWLGWMSFDEATASTNIPASVPLGFTFPAGTYYVFIKCLDYFVGSNYTVALGSGVNTSAVTVDADWNRHWNYGVAVTSATSFTNAAIVFRKGLGPGAAAGKILFEGLYITTNFYEDFTDLGFDKVVEYRPPAGIDASAVIPGNLIEDSSFELWPSHGWGFQQFDSDQNFAQKEMLDHSTSVHGTRSLHINAFQGSTTSTNNGGYVWHRIFRVRGNRSYAISAYAKSTNATRLTMTLAPHTFAPTNRQSVTNISVFFTTSSTWTRYQTNGILWAYPGEYVQLTIQAGIGDHPEQAADLWLDAIQVEEGTTASAYAPKYADEWSLATPYLANIFIGWFGILPAEYPAW